MHTKTTTRRAVLAGFAAAAPALAGIASSAASALAAPILSSDEAFFEEARWRWDQLCPETKTFVRALAWTDNNDPIFAAIERHRAGYALYRAACDEQEVTWAANVEAHRGTPQHEPARLLSEATVDRAYGVETDALEDMCRTVPTSLAGIAALMEYLRSINHSDGREVFETVDVYGFLSVIESAVGKTSSGAGAIMTPVRQSRRRAGGN
jgi:hypothetical protein